MVFESANSDGLSERGNGTGLGNLFNGTGSLTIYVVGSAADGVNQAYWSAAQPAANVDKVFNYKQNSNTPLYRRVDGNDTTNDVVYGSSIDTNNHVISCVYNGAESTIYVDAINPVSASNIQEPTGLDIFSIGFLDQGTPSLYLDGDIYEVLVCVGVAHDASTFAEVTAQLEAEYNL